MGSDRISGICYNGVEEKAFTYVYNANGALAEHVDNVNNRTYVYTYDASGRVTQITQKSNVDAHVTFMQEVTYDEHGRTSGVYYHYPDMDTHTLAYTEYAYNEMGGVDSVTSNASNSGRTITAYTYDDFGRISTESNTVSLSSNRQLFDKHYYFQSESTNQDGVYEASSRVEQILISDSINDFWYYYTYDVLGNITHIQVEQDGTEVERYQYEYDDLGQLVRENVWRLNNVNTNKTITYTYDAGGNRTSKKVYEYTEGSLDGLTYTQETWAYVQDTTSLDKWNDVMVSFKGNAVITDEIGNVLSDGRYTYEWQNGRQLKKVHLDEDSFVWFTYNDDGIRTGKYYGETSAEGGWEYTLDGSQIIRQVSKRADGSFIMEYRFFYDANGRPKSFRIRNFNTDGSVNKDITCHYATNLQGDVVALYNDAGERIAEYLYDAWGNSVGLRVFVVAATTAMDNRWVAQMNPLRYRGYYWDSDLKLYYLQSRYYDPEMGRFLNADAYINANGDLIGFNMYAYCSNNPVMYTDPSGENGEVALGTWMSTMWWLHGVDGPIPIGDIIYWSVTAVLAISLLASINGGDKHHIIHGSKGNHEEGWKNFGIDPKKPDKDNWDKLLPIINEVLKEGETFKEEIVEGGNKLIYYAKEFANEGKTVVVRIWENVQTGVQKLSDAWPLN